MLKFLHDIPLKISGYSIYRCIIGQTQYLKPVKQPICKKYLHIGGIVYEH